MTLCTPPRPGPVLVTRPGPDARHWVGQLQQAGIAAEALPLIEIAAVDEVSAVRLAWAQLQDYAALMFVSGNAVAHFFVLNPALDQSERALDAIKNRAALNLPDLRFMAPGPGTVRALLKAGVPVGQLDAPAADAAQFDSEALWQVIGARPWQGRRVLIVRGQSAGPSAALAGTGRDWLARQWQDAGAQVDFVSVYQRRAPRFTEPQLQRMQVASHDGSVWLFSSAEALGHLPKLAGVNWSQARAIATHPRIASAVRAAGWGVVIESRPSLQDIIASIESMHP